MTDHTSELSDEEWWTKYGFTYRHYCEHALDPFVTTNGTLLFASAVRDAALRNREPDLAFYLDPSWHPRTVAFHLGWHDMSVPSLPMRKVVDLARLAIEHAREGREIEIGCIGGHGRTGTFLAVCDLVDGCDTARQSIANVRNTYCQSAIETRSQEFYLLQIEYHLKGLPIPQPPPPPKRKKGKSKKANKNTPK